MLKDMDNLLRMEKISKSFPGVKALDSVHFELKRGEVHAIAGENGAGKSTFMKVLTGIYKQDEGEIYYTGNLSFLKTPNTHRKWESVLYIRNSIFCPIFLLQIISI